MIHLTQKEVKNNYNVITLSYCTLQNLTHYVGTRFCNSGVYGWNSDLYLFDKYNICISIGYRPVSGFRPSRELVETYEKLKPADVNQAAAYLEHFIAEVRAEMRNKK